MTSPDPALVVALTQSVLPLGIAVAARDPGLLPERADADEGLAVQNAVPARVAEFHAGRAAARAAMVELGLPPRPIPMGPDRAPLWPEGVTGSISHCPRACVAAIGHARDWRGLGVDLEEATPLDALLVGEVCTRKERQWLGTQPRPERGLMAKVIFSIKEAVYKAQYPLSGEVFGFDVLEVVIDRDESGFLATFQLPKGPFEKGAGIAGAYVHAAGLVVAGAAIGHGQAGTGQIGAGQKDGGQGG